MQMPPSATSHATSSGIAKLPHMEPSLPLQGYAIIHPEFGPSCFSVARVPYYALRRPQAIGASGSKTTGCRDWALGGLVETDWDQV